MDDRPAWLPPGRVHLALVACLFLGALGLRLERITEPSVESRELHNALIARQYFYGDGNGLPGWQRRVREELGDVAQPIEPPVHARCDDGRSAARGDVGGAPHWERPTRLRLLAAGAVASVASVVKPGVALVFLVALFAALALSRRALRDALVGGRLPVFAAMATALPAAYYIYGTLVRDFLAGESGGRVQPRLLATESFWSGWWDMVSTVLVFPQRQSYLAFVPIALAVGGLAVVRGGLPRAILAGLAVGFVAFALTVPGFTSTHAYYALPLVPLFALAVGSFAGSASARARAAGRVPFAACMALAALALGVGVYKGHAVLSGDPPSPAIADYRRIGELTGHTAHAIVVDERLRSPISYWGWMVARYWYQLAPLLALLRRGAGEWSSRSAPRVGARCTPGARSPTWKRPSSASTFRAVATAGDIRSRRSASSAGTRETARTCTSSGATRTTRAHGPASKAILLGRPIEFLLIDGDHSYDGVGPDF